VRFGEEIWTRAPRGIVFVSAIHLASWTSAERKASIGYMDAWGGKSNTAAEMPRLRRDNIAAVSEAEPLSADAAKTFKCRSLSPQSK
jgi:hypothetical protein